MICALDRHLLQVGRAFAPPNAKEEVEEGIWLRVIENHDIFKVVEIANNRGGSFLLISR